MKKLLWIFIRNSYVSLIRNSVTELLRKNSLFYHWGKLFNKEEAVSWNVRLSNKTLSLSSHWVAVRKILKEVRNKPLLSISCRYWCDRLRWSNGEFTDVSPALRTAGNYTRLEIACKCIYKVKSNGHSEIKKEKMKKHTVRRQRSGKCRILRWCN